MKKVIYALLAVIILSSILYFVFPQYLIKGLYYVALQKGDFKTESVEIDGVKYFYLDNHREGVSTMVLLHGYTDRKGSWISFINPISKDYRIVIPDLLGHGDNPKNFNVSHDFVSQALLVKQVSDKLSLSKFHFVGISMGGAISAHFTHHYPDKIQSLTLISNAGINDYAHLSKVDSLMLAYPTAEEKLENIPLLPHKINKSSLQEFKKYLFIQPLFTPLGLFKVYLGTVVENRDFYIKVLKDFMEPKTGKFKNPLNDILPEINVPINIIWGKQDPLLDVSCVEVMKGLLPTIPQITIIDECGHGTIAEKPEETLEAMTTFLDKVK